MAVTQAPYRLNASFVLELVVALRWRGLRVGPVDAAQATQLIASQERWSAAELFDLLAALFLRRPGEAQILREELDALLTKWPPAELFDLLAAPSTALSGEVQRVLREELDALLAKQSAPKEVRQPIPQPPVEVETAIGGVSRTRQAATRLSAWLLAAFHGLVRRLAGVHYGWWIAAAAVVVTLVWPGGPNDPDNNICAIISCPVSQTSAVSLSSAISAALLALLSVPVVIWVRRRLSKPSGGERSPEKPDTEPELPEAADDGSSFRVTVLGGTPPQFLDRGRAAQIVELFAYRDGGPDPARIDIDKTIAAQARGGDPTVSWPARRRELPALLILVDQTSPQRFWNTLAREFEATMSERGIACERIEFAGSLFDTRGRPRPAQRDIEAALGAPGWLVLCIFAEAHRLSVLDRRFFGLAAEAGPILFLEQRDPLLWDGRQSRLAALHKDIVIEPATGAGLQAGLTRIFAAGREPPPAKPPETGRAQWIDRLKDAGMTGWLEDCALVEPMSFALAERLRKLYAGKDPTVLAFSLPAALPGSWLGPEGLRYAPTVRRRLLNDFALRPSDDRAKALAIVNHAFDEAPAAGKTAQAMKAYAHAQANLFASDPQDEALQQIFRAEREGYIDPPAVQDFCRRLRPPADPAEDSTIRLPNEPARAEFRARLSRAGGQDQRARTDDIAAARWRIGAPQVRVALRGDNGFPSMPQAAFLSGLRTLLVASPAPDGVPTVRMISTAFGSESSLDLSGARGAVDGLWTARDSPAAVLHFDGGALFRLHPTGEPGASAPLQAQPLEFKGSAALRFAAALDWTGRRLAHVSAGERGMTVFSFDGKPQVIRLEGSADITAIAWTSRDGILLGFENGEIDAIDVSDMERAVRPEHVCKAGGAPAAFAVLRDGEGIAGIAVGVATGRIELHLASGGLALEGADSLPQCSFSSAYMFGGVPGRMAFLPDSPAASVRSGRESVSNGCSLAVLSPTGRFDILGFPLPPRGLRNGETTAPTAAPLPFTPMALADRHPGTGDGPSAVAAFSAQSRSIALWQGGRIEVRPLIYEQPALPDLPPAEASSEPAPAEAVPRVAA